MTTTRKERHLGLSGHCWTSKTDVIHNLILCEPSMEAEAEVDSPSYLLVYRRLTRESLESFCNPP